MQFNKQFGQVPVPNSTAVLVLGICSIFPGCLCLGFIGITCGIIALVLAKKGLAAYNTNPGQYTIVSYNNLKAGRVCGIIGICLSAIVFIINVIYFAFLGAALSVIPWSSIN
ncbi:MAG: hypothetical protein JST26_03045 [Bacteroidetes bacterium]|nr:hypothetical protein [Bacteroidota bacterium]